MKIKKYQKGSNITHPIKNPVIPKSDDQESTDWYANWLNNRRDQLNANMNSMKSANNPKPIFDEIKYLINGNNAERYKVNKEYYKQVNNMANAKETSFDDFIKLSNYSEDMLKNLLGVSFDRPKTKTSHVSYNYNDPDYYDEVRIHERTHAAKARPQEEAISKIVNLESLLNTPRNELKRGYDQFDFEYSDSAKEIYGRLNEFRKKYKLNPSKKYTAEELRQLIKGGDDFDILNRYDDKTVESLFNDIAYNNNKYLKTSNVMFAKAGSKIKYLDKY